jgi:NAD(P)-dependent dehydrogenase (short-subunit alcohol dehydrogenase family)
MGLRAQRESARPLAVARAAAGLTPCNGASAAILNIASTRALMSERGNEAYAASEGGLLVLTHALANSLSPRIRVNAMCPGWIDTRREAPWRLRPCSLTPGHRGSDSGGIHLSCECALTAG